MKCLYPIYKLYRIRAFSSINVERFRFSLKVNASESVWMTMQRVYRHTGMHCGCAQNRNKKFRPVFWHLFSYSQAELHKTWRMASVWEITFIFLVCFTSFSTSVHASVFIRDSHGLNALSPVVVLQLVETYFNSQKRSWWILSDWNVHECQSLL